MIRTSPNGVLALMILILGTVAVVAPAAALTKEEIFRRCVDNVKEEFGEAAVEFRSIRRANDREWAFGELEMTDGSKRRIRCQINNSRKVDVKFPKARSNAADSPWTDERPENAGFIERKEDEKPNGEDADQNDTAGEDTSGPRRVTVGGANTPSETQQDAQDQSGGTTAPTDPDQTGDAATTTDPDKTGTPQQTPTEETADKTQTGAQDQPAEEKRSGPVFRKVVTQ